MTRKKESKKLIMSVLLILESLIRTFGFGKIHLRQSDIDVGEPRTSAVFNVSPLSLSVMPSSDAHCSKIDSSLYGLLINGRMTSLFLQASQKKRDSGVDIRVVDNGGTLLLVMMSMTLSSSACRITNQASRGKI